MKVYEGLYFQGGKCWIVFIFLSFHCLQLVLETTYRETHLQFLSVKQCFRLTSQTGKSCVIRINFNPRYNLSYIQFTSDFNPYLIPQYIRFHFRLRIFSIYSYLLATHVLNESACLAELINPMPTNAINSFSDLDPVCNRVRCRNVEIDTVGTFSRVTFRAMTCHNDPVADWSSL